MTEKWKEIEGYPDYEVSDFGNIRSKKTYHRKNVPIKPLKQRDNGHGYLTVCLWKGNKRRNFYVHRLVADAFVANPNNLPQVNHLDYDRHNNRVSNLEWTTAMENTRYSTCRAKHPRFVNRSRTGEKYVYKKGDRYRVAVYGCKERYCKTFSDAIEVRDKLVKELGYEKYT